MKRLFFLLLGALLSSGAYAQLGVKVGVSEAVLNGENINASTSYRTTYHAGIFYEARLIGPLSVQPELLYSLQGGSLKGQFEDFDTKLHYFTVPILAKVTVGPVFVEVGPQFSFLLHARKDGTMPVIGPSSSSASIPTYENYAYDATSDLQARRLQPVRRRRPEVRPPPARRPLQRRPQQRQRRPHPDRRQRRPAQEPCVSGLRGVAARALSGEIVRW